MAELFKSSRMRAAEVIFGALLGCFKIEKVIRSLLLIGQTATVNKLMCILFYIFRRRQLFREKDNLETAL